MFYDFSLFDPVDDPSTHHRIYACSSLGSDFSRMPSLAARTIAASAAPVDVDFEVGWWKEGFGLATPGLRSLTKQIRKYVDKGHGATDRPFIIYGQSGQVTLGLYVGQGLLNQGVSKSALRLLHDNIAYLNVSTPSLAMQLCGPGYDSTHVFGVMVTSNGTFTPIQDAIKTWANGTCLSFAESKGFPGQAIFTTPLVQTNGTTNSTIRARELRPRAECRTVQVESGDSCANLATKCGISGYDFTRFNPGSSFCSTLKPKQHVCCSSGDLPDFRPKPNPNGSCFSYQVKSNDNCANLAAEYGLTIQDLEDFNKNTWGWNGCKLLFLDAVICLSKGPPPFPAPISNAVCGPQKPGSKPPTDGSNIADLNPCPLKACCNIWGQCGFTKDFCIDTNTGAPGTAAPGTHGCISNCGGLDIVKGDGTGAIKIGYFEGYNLGRECLYQDVRQIDKSKYTHIHFAFGTLTPTFEVNVGDALSSYQFRQFKRLSGVKRILSFGGWDFSTGPNTYHIFRESVLPENRFKTASNIANFIKEHGLDGVDIDWEYPGAPDIPGVPCSAPCPGDHEGLNYLYFLIVLKNLLPGKSVSIAAPSSYWYLKQYPIEAMGRILDYIVFMTYDLHGQWDVDNRWSQEGCPEGNCLRSPVNLTETRTAVAMIRKAGVPGRKVVVGVTSYGRSFEMADPGCWGPQCRFTGSRWVSNAKKGRCTGTSGYGADAEIAEIIAGGTGSNRARAGRVVASFVDASSHTDVLVYDNNQWVGWMSPQTKKTRENLYAAWGLGGITDWATDLQTFNAVPPPTSDWPTFISLAASGQEPGLNNTRTGQWAKYKCDHPLAVDKLYKTPSVRWHGLDSDTAWNDAVTIWKENDHPNNPGSTFIDSVTTTFRMLSEVNCEAVESCGCDLPSNCPAGANHDDDVSGPAAMLVYNSLQAIHGMHHTLYDELVAASRSWGDSFDHMANIFAPVPSSPHDWETNLMLNLLTLGTLSIGGIHFNRIIKNKDSFSPRNWDDAKDITLTVIGQSTTIAKDILASWEPDWTGEMQAAFKHNMNKIIDGWRDTTARALERLFNGRDESIRALEKAMANGALIEGLRVDPDYKPDTRDTNITLRANLRKTLFAYSIPTLWRFSGTFAFVLDTGLPCGTRATDYVSDETAVATAACYDGMQYYLVHPKGDHEKCICLKANQWAGCDIWECDDTKFAAPPGIGALGGDFEVTREELVRGSVRTWLSQGKKNTGVPANPDDADTVNDLLDGDFTTPGFIRLPVCGPERALQSWTTARQGSSVNYPCDIPLGPNLCGISSFDDETSDVSPLASDCLQIIRNFEGNGETMWETQVLGKNQRQLVSHGSCRFGVEATEQKGNVHFHVGGEDVADIINDAVRRFRRSNGRVGAKGEMRCYGNLRDQGVLWGIY